MPEYTFIWFGHVPMYSIPRNIRKIVKEDHPENVLFPGYIRGEIIEGAYSGADLFFFPSYEETEGIVVLEALASKQNVLVRDIPVYNGWLEDSKNCYMGKTNEIYPTDPTDYQSRTTEYDTSRLSNSKGEVSIKSVKNLKCIRKCTE